MKLTARFTTKENAKYYREELEKLGFKKLSSVLNKENAIDLESNKYLAFIEKRYDRHRIVIYTIDNVDKDDDIEIPLSIIEALYNI